MKKLDKGLLIIGTFTILVGTIGSIYTFQSLKKERLKQHIPISEKLVEATLNLTDLPYETINIYQTEQPSFEFHEQGLPHTITVKASTKENQTLIDFDMKKKKQNKPSNLVFSGYDQLDIYVPAHLDSLHISSGQSKLNHLYISDLTLKNLDYQLNAASLNTQAIHVDTLDINYHGHSLSLENNHIMDSLTLKGVSQNLYVQSIQANQVIATIETHQNTWRDIEAEKTTIEQKKGETTFFNPKHNVNLTSKSGPINVYLIQDPKTLSVKSSFGDLTLIVPATDQKKYEQILNHHHENIDLNMGKGKQYVYYAYPDKEEQFILSNKKSLTNEERDEYRVYHTPYEIIWENLRQDDD